MGLRKVKKQAIFGKDIEMSGHIYLIKNKDLYKIGVTKDFKRRMKVLKPDEIVKVLEIDSYKALEKSYTGVIGIHAYLKLNISG